MAWAKDVRSLQQTKKPKASVQVSHRRDLLALVELGKDCSTMRSTSWLAGWL
jgi:hypothetical protein